MKTYLNADFELIKTPEKTKKCPTFHNLWLSHYDFIMTQMRFSTEVVTVTLHTTVGKLRLVDMFCVTRLAE